MTGSLDEVHPGAGARQVLEGRARKQRVQLATDFVIERLHLGVGEQHLGGNGSGELGGGEAAHWRDDEELVIVLPPRAVVATADAAALVVAVFVGPYPTASDREVGGVEELAVERVEVEEHGPELPLHLVVEHEGSGISRRQR